MQRIERIYCRRYKGRSHTLNSPIVFTTHYSKTSLPFTSNFFSSFKMPSNQNDAPLPSKDEYFSFPPLEDNSDSESLPRSQSKGTPAEVSGLERADTCSTTRSDTSEDNGSSSMLKWLTTGLSSAIGWKGTETSPTQ